MGAYRVRKLFKFEMAHVLSRSYSEECQTIHGHSYRLEVIITADLNADGMVIDFKLLKEIVKKKVIDKFDHSLVIPNINKADYDWVKLIPGKKVVVDYNPTAENMAKRIYSSIFWEIRKMIPDILLLVVRLHETDTGYAEYSGGYLK